MRRRRRYVIRRRMPRRYRSVYRARPRLRRRPRRSLRSRRRMRGGFLPFLIPLAAAAIGAIPGIASTIISAEALKREKR